MKQLIFILSFLSIVGIYASPTSISPNIKVDQFGYRPNDTKVAVIAQPKVGYNAPSTYTPGTIFKIRRWNDDVEVFSGSITSWKNGITHTQSGDKVWWFDFTTLTIIGDYYVEDVFNRVSSDKFAIHNDIYTSVLRAATHALFYQRCGIAITASYGGMWTHTACHITLNQDLACRDVETPNNAATAKDLSGGWHDAGDYNKYVNYSYNAVHNLLFAYQETPSVFTDNWGIPESQNGVPDVLDELKYELDWLIKMQNANGSVLNKVSVTDFSEASPPNNDLSKRYYGKASTSATLTAASIFAHASLVYKTIMPAFSDILKSKAISAWDWAAANPSVMYQNTGFESSNPEVTTYDILARKIGAAALLFAATNNPTYKIFFETNYTSLHCLQWAYFYSFEAVYNDLALFYTTIPTANASISTNILNSFKTSTANETDLFPSFLNQTDAYRAYMNDGDYVWGNNMQKALVGVMYENMIKFNQNTAEYANYRTQALDYLHFLHGVNALSLVMLSNTSSIGADNYVTQIYHAWTGDGTIYDKNPIPALMTGGINKDFTIKTISPPANQPIQKAYKDWNTSDPENAWEITEPSISYQTAYIRLLSKYATQTALSPVWSPTDLAKIEPLSIFPNPTDSSLDFQINTPLNTDFIAQIMDELGRIVWTEKYQPIASQKNIKINFGHLANGNYHLKVVSEQHVLSKQFTIVH
jgi:endoglucanase